VGEFSPSKQLKLLTKYVVSLAYAQADAQLTRGGLQTVLPKVAMEGSSPIARSKFRGCSAIRRAVFSARRRLFLRGSRGKRTRASRLLSEEVAR
jgi:hypothetical protein